MGTITEIYDYLRLLYASVGQPHCPKCGLPITRQTAEQIVERIVAQAPGERITVYAPLVRGRKGEFREELEALDQQGFRARIDGAMTELTEGMRLDKRKNHTVEAVVDRIILKPLPANGNETATPPLADPSNREPRTRNGQPRFDTRRLETSVAKALQMAKGLVLIGIQGANRAQDETLYSSSMACPDCGIDVPRLEPRSFSFNSAYGACPQCNGLGSTYDFDPAKTITDWSKPLLDGAMGPGSGSAYLQRLIRLAAERYKIDLKLPFSELTKPQQDLLLYGPPRNELGRTGFHGIFAYLRANLDETKSEGYREYMMQYMSATVCPRCQGRRLRPESLAVTVQIAGEDALDCGVHGALHGACAGGRAGDEFYRARPDRRRPATARDRRAAGVSERGGAGLSLAGPLGGDALRRRGTEDTAGDADRLAPARSAVCARRAIDRAASAGQPAAAPGAHELARPGQHGAGGRA